MRLLLALAFASAVSAQSGRFTLSGQVVDGVSGSPLAGVDVTLQTDQYETAAETFAADQQGRFAFRNLPAGGYILSAESPAFGVAHYGGAADPTYTRTIRLGAEQGDRVVLFRIMPRGVIEGTVRDEFGEPVLGSLVLLLRPTWHAGRTNTDSVLQRQTDDRGRFRFGNLPPGGYMVCSGNLPGAPAP